MAAEIERRGDDLDRRAEVLRDCLRKLPDDHRTVVLARYHDEREIADIAAATGRTAEAVYRLLSRIRAALNTCISRQLGAAGRSA